MGISGALLNAQESIDYEIHWGRDLALMSLGSGLFTAGMLVSNEVEPPVLRQNAGHFWFPFDRVAPRFSDRFLSQMSDVTLIMAFSLPLFVSGFSGFHEHGFDDLIMWSESCLIMGGLTLLSKGLFRRPRPYVYRLSETPGTRFTKDAARSCFLGHKSAAVKGGVFGG